jgi:Tn3 transposase DDE domain
MGGLAPHHMPVAGSERTSRTYAPDAGPGDQTYRAVAGRLPENKAVRFETVAGKPELVLSSLDKLEEPSSLVALRNEVQTRMPRVDLPEILLEIAARTGCMDAFTHLTERTARAADLTTSLCAVLLAEACNTGPEPFVRQDTPALRRDRLLWVDQNYMLWTHLNERGFDPEIPKDASWGERYFHMPDPDGHQLSFARPLP